MIDTIQTKAQQIANGYFEVGSGPEHILILGSCRTVPFLNYLNRANSDNRFTIRRIDPCESQVLETDERVLSAIKAADIFLHEHVANYGMLNTSREAEKNLYQFGMDPHQDISIPNWHDHLVLENDWPAYGQPTPENYAELGEAAIEKFCNLCRLTSFPEMEPLFWEDWRNTRYFWRPNHTSAAFTLFVFRRINLKFLKLPLDDAFWDAARQEDLFKDPHTIVTDNDVKNYGLTWR